MQVDYAFRKGARVPAGADPNQIGARLDEIRGDAEGALTPEAVLECARDPEDPLHKWFDWKDTIAAAKWRLHQARNLIGAVCVVYRKEGDGTPRMVRAYVNIQTEDAQEYRAVVDAEHDRDLRATLLAVAWKELIAFRQKYSEIRDFVGIFDEIKKLEKAVQKRIAA